MTKDTYKLGENKRKERLKRKTKTIDISCLGENKRINNKYVLIGEVGRGSMGVVYKIMYDFVETDVFINDLINKKIISEDSETKKRLESLDYINSDILKELPETIKKKEDILKIFNKNYCSFIACKRILNNYDKDLLELIKDYLENEIRYLKCLAHENLIHYRFDITIDEFNQEDTFFFLEYIEYDLQKYLEDIINGNNTVDDKVIYSIMHQICEGLEYLHDERQVVHRDIKPSNILLKKINFNEYSVKIADLSAAKIMKNGIIKGNQIVRTDHYIAPEQKEKNNDINEKVDIYPLGIILYELLTKKVYKNENDFDTNEGIYGAEVLLLKKMVGKERPSAKELKTLFNRKLTSIKQREKTMPIKQQRKSHVSETQIRVSQLVVKLDSNKIKDNEKEIISKIKKKYKEQIKEIKMDSFSVDAQEQGVVIDKDKDKDKDKAIAKGSSYHFVLDENFEPIKVGDGSFGIVYLLYDHATSHNFAIKIFYSTVKEGDSSIKLDDLDQEAKLRFEHEVSSTYIINQHDDIDITNTGLVTISGGTELFRNSNAYKALNSYFDDNRIKVSNYAIIMKYYDFTLKDILELNTGLYCVRKKDFSKLDIMNSEIENLCDRPETCESDLKKNISKIIKESDKNFNKICSYISQWNGYDILSRLGFEDRFEVIASFLLEIAKGINTLHLLGLYHLDLKPGNIFVDKKGNSCVGDFGFLKMTDKIKTTSVATAVQSLLPLGTRHFRSPEQKDYFDICDVSIECLSDNTYKLTAIDPKFFNTIVEIGDKVIFSKDFDNEQFDVMSIKTMKDHVEIIIQSNQKKLEDADKSQAIFYKSSEQKDNFYICDVSIECLSNNTYRLTATDDQKLFKTLGDKGYKVVFTKDSNKEQFDVSNINTVKDHAEIIIQSNQKKLENFNKSQAIFYKSPEQKDNFYICDLSRKYLSNNDYRLTTIDPKFFKTVVVQKGYKIFFTDDSDKQQFDVTSIKKEDENVAIMINQKKLKDDNKSQAIFYKNQKEKTDIFGFGAILFDLMTCGLSAEHFYENIRFLDDSEIDIETIMSKYDEVKFKITDDSRYINLFNPFKHPTNNDYLDEKYVTIILKCILYKTKNTYCSQNDPAKKLYEDLEKIAKPITPQDNVLLEGDLSDQLIMARSQSEDENNMIGKLVQLYKCKFYNKEKVRNRLKDGIDYFESLVDMVHKNIKEKNISQLLPQNISITFSNNKYASSCAIKAYSLREVYKKELKEDKMYTRFNRDYKNAFVPDMILNLRRSIRLTKSLETDKDTQKMKVVVDFEPGSNPTKISKGDWIVINSTLWRVDSDFDSKNKTINIEQDDSLSNGSNSMSLPGATVNNDYVRAIFYQNFDEKKYYFEMLGLYIYHLFFVKAHPENLEKPDKIEYLLSIAASYNNMNIIKILPELYNDRFNFEINPVADFNINLNKILAFIATMYLKFSLTGNDNSYYNKTINDENYFEHVKRDTKELKLLIDKFVETHKREVDNEELSCQNINQILSYISSIEPPIDPYPENFSLRPESNIIPKLNEMFELTRQENNCFKNVAKRYAKGIFLYEKLVNFIDKDLLIDNKYLLIDNNDAINESIFFSQIIPEKMLISGSELILANRDYKDEKSYEEDIKNDYLYGNLKNKINFDVNHSFVPEYMNHCYREIVLLKIENEDYKYEYYFTDSFSNDFNKMNGWLSINTGTESMTVRITEENVSNQENRHFVVINDEELNKRCIKQPMIKAIFYQKIDKLSYCLETLGLYLYSIFFYATENNFLDKPVITNIYHKLTRMHGFDNLYILPKPDHKSKEVKKNLKTFINIFMKDKKDKKYKDGDVIIDSLENQDRINSRFSGEIDSWKLKIKSWFSKKIDANKQFEMIQIYVIYLYSIHTFPSIKNSILDRDSRTSRIKEVKAYTSLLKKLIENLFNIVIPDENIPIENALTAIDSSIEEKSLKKNENEKNQNNIENENLNLFDSDLFQCYFQSIVQRNTLP